MFMLCIDIVPVVTRLNTWSCQADRGHHLSCHDGDQYGQYPDSKVHVANMGPNWVLPAPSGPHVGPMNLAIRVTSLEICVILIRYKQISPNHFRMILPLFMNQNLRALLPYSKNLVVVFCLEVQLASKPTSLIKI